VFFQNSVCLGCGAALGYEPKLARLLRLTPGPAPDSWLLPRGSGAERKLYRRCANLQTPAACNWLIPEEEFQAGKTLCISCGLNRTIPDLSIPQNAECWRRIELAKRRLVSSLLAFGLPVASRVSEDPQHGIAFDLLHVAADGAPILTGHSAGVITLNIEEAEDSTRERVREQMHEPYRTVLGHLRHETGHYYWDRLIAGSPWLEPFHALFGDETRDYAQYLLNHYQQGPPPNWPEHYVSAYASVHPWEDWAETWAHYLHLVDTLETASSFRLAFDSLPFEGFHADSLWQPDAPNAQEFLELLTAWGRVTVVLNELSRSMGLPDFYPFVLSRDAVAKLHFVHTLLTTVHS
jgi:hypothetical protein